MSSRTNISMSLSSQSHQSLNAMQKTGLSLVAISFVFLLLGILNKHEAVLFLTLFLASLSAGVLIYAYYQYKDQLPGIKNQGVFFSSLGTRGAIAWILGLFLTGFYVLLYWFPEYLGKAADSSSQGGLIALFDPLSLAISGKAATEWFVYGVLYTLAILLMGFKFILKYRHNKYQIVRTISVMFFQLGFAFLIPELLMRLNLPYQDFKNMWPLNYYFFDEWNVSSMLSAGNFGLLMLLWGIAMIFLVSPILTYFYGKRWYCSWVCGCAGLAETAGDPFRHLSNKSIKAWRIERWMVHSVLIFAFVMTIAVIYSYLFDDPAQHWFNKQSFAVLIIMLCLSAVVTIWIMRKKWFTDKNRIALYVGLISLGLITLLMTISLFSGVRNVFLIEAELLRRMYGFYIGAAFSGVIGVGFYPILGNRVWCRFGCPMAAILGLQQKWFSRFRISTNGGQCISCGNCSTYCEMGIDVKSYAQRGENIVRASCVGCGICSAVCPRGVLKLENGPHKNKTKNVDPIKFENGKLTLNL